MAQIDKDKLLYIISLKSNEFKIGKTGKALEERKNADDYRDTYNNIISLYETTSKDLASWLEAYYIDSYYGKPNCANEKNGYESINDEMADTGTYTVYVVWR